MLGAGKVSAVGDWRNKNNFTVHHRVFIAVSLKAIEAEK